MHGTLRFLYLSHLLYGICVKIFIMNRCFSKSYTTSKNTIEGQYTERGQLQCQLLLVIFSIIATESDLHVLKDFHLKKKHGMLLTTG